MVLSDKDLIKYANEGRAILDPFLHYSESKGKLSYGLSPMGYDVRLSPKELWVSKRRPNYTADPLDFDVDLLMEPANLIDGEHWLIPPGHHALGVTLEKFMMPPDVSGFVDGKSTYARCGLIVNCTLIEPGWEGFLTLELHNASSYQLKVYANLGIAQVSFFRAETPPLKTYQQKGGLYQHQPPRVVFPNNKF